MAEFDLNPIEYAEFLNFKKEKLLKELKEIELKLSKLSKGNSVQQTHLVSIEDNHVQQKDKNGARGSVGWKFIIDEVLKEFPTRYLTANEIVDLVIKRPNNKIAREVAIKSVGSTLHANSAPNKNRYLTKKDKGVKTYSLNKDFKE